MKSIKNKKFKKKLKLQKRDKTVEKKRISIKKKYRMILINIIENSKYRILYWLTKF
jgi:hypothetical protein